MAYSFLIFDFGGDEEVAQQARHRLEGWRQGFRLDKKLQLKFDRKGNESEPESDSEPASKSKAAKGGSKSKAASAKSKADAKEAGQVGMIVRLDFSDHEKLSHQRWLDRIPTEEPFKNSNPRIVRPNDPEFEKTSQYFDSLEPSAGKNYSQS